MRTNVIVKLEKMKKSVATKKDSKSEKLFSNRNAIAILEKTNERHYATTETALTSGYVKENQDNDLTPNAADSTNHSEFLNLQKSNECKSADATKYEVCSSLRDHITLRRPSRFLD